MIWWIIDKMKMIGSVCLLIIAFCLVIDYLYRYPCCQNRHKYRWMILGGMRCKWCGKKEGKDEV